MIVIGLTGGIATGKSTLSRMIWNYGIPLFDTDAEVHMLYDNDDDVYRFCKSNFPTACEQARVDRKILSDIVFREPERLQLLENEIMYHLDINLAIWMAEMRYVKKKHMIAIDAPLLFEGHWHKHCDYTITTDCHETTQKDRAMLRSGYTEEKYEKIIERQIKRETRLAMADFVIDTEQPIADCATKIFTILSELDHA